MNSGGIEGDYCLNLDFLCRSDDVELLFSVILVI